jgi:hypothetical protein
MLEVVEVRCGHCIKFDALDEERFGSNQNTEFMKAELENINHELDGNEDDEN